MEINIIFALSVGIESSPLYCIFRIRIGTVHIFNISCSGLIYFVSIPKLIKLEFTGIANRNSAPGLIIYFSLLFINAFLIIFMFCS